MNFLYIVFGYSACFPPKTKMHLKDTVWEELSIWEDMANISDFEYSDSEQETHKEFHPDKVSTITSTKCDDSLTTFALSTTDTYQGCNWDVESCFGS
jgi:hypothetical protein